METYSVVKTEEKSPPKMTVEAHLLHGEHNAIPARVLMKMTGYSSIRNLQAEIERERVAGALILSKCTEGGGYYLPNSRAEIARYETTLRRRAISTLRTLKTARAALREIDGQQNMEALI